MPDPAHNTQLNKEMRLHVAAILYFLSRVAVVGFVFAVPALYFLRGQVEIPLVAGGAVLVTSLFVGYYVAAAGLRCAACSGPVMMDNGNRKHPHAQRFPGLNHRARVAWDILFCSSYQCMYCNTRCRCKKNWGGKSGGKNARRGRTFEPSAPRHAASGETFPDSIFGDLSPLNPTAAAQEFEPAGFPSENNGATPPETIVSPAFAPASVFPGVRTVPIAVPQEKAETGDSEKEESIIEIAAPAVSSEPAPPFFTLPKSPMPWTAPVPVKSSEPDTSMNRPPQDQHPMHGNNPFLAAAAAMPLPPGPVLPHIPGGPSRPQPETRPQESTGPFHQEFPFTAPAAPSSEGPPPWTLPSMPVTAERPMAPQPSPQPEAPRVPGVIAAPVLPPVPSMTAPVTPVTGPVPLLTTPIPTAAVPVDLIKDVVSVLEDGRRALTDAFQGLIERLEARLSAPAVAAPPAPAPVQIVEKPVIPAMLPVTPVEQAIAAPVEYPQPPAPVIVQPREETVYAPLPPTPPAVIPAPPVAATPAPVAEPMPFAAPRRKFARPSGAAAQQLSSALNDVFVAPSAPPAAPVAPVAPEPYANGHTNGHYPGYSHAPVAAPVPETVPVFPPPPRPQSSVSPFDLVQSPVLPPPPVHRQQSPLPEHHTSPFAVSDSPLSSPGGLPLPPAPFTFLKSEGDGFTPVAQSPATPGYDPLDDTPLPWMQPVGGRA